jgi:NTE family protein
MLCEVDGTPTRVMHQFSAEHTPNTQVLIALLASSAIPTVFPMICLSEKSPGQWVEDSNGFVHIDGGFVDDLPIGIFDKKKYYPGDTEIDEKTNPEILNATVYNPETLGFIVYSNREVVDLETNKKDIQPIRHHQLGKIIYSLVNGAVFGPQMYMFSLNNDLNRTVLIQNLNISPINFRITAAQKDGLENAGVEADKKFFTEHPECRPAAVSSTSAFFPPKPLDTSKPSQQIHRGPTNT